MRPLALLLVLAGCATDKTPTDTDDTDAPTGDTNPGDTEDTADTEDTGGSDTGAVDTGSADTGDTGSSAACALSPAPTGSVRTTEPTSGEQITFERRIEACVSASGIEGQWRIDIRGGNGDLVCGYVSPFTATAAVTGSACTACDEAFGGAAFTGPTRQAGSNCDLFGWEDRVPFYDDGGTDRNYAAIGAATGSSPDLYHQHASDGWTVIDPSTASGSTTVTRTTDAFSDATRVRVTFTTSFEY